MARKKKGDAPANGNGAATLEFPKQKKEHKPRKQSLIQFQKEDLPDNDELPPDDFSFVQRIVIGDSAVRAYLASGHKAKSYGAAAVAAHNLLKTDKIKEAIRRWKARRVNKTDMTLGEITARLTKIAENDVTDAYNPDGTLKHIHLIDARTRMAIRSIETEEIWEGSGDQRRLVGYNKKLHTADPIRAMQELNKLKGHYPSTKHEVSGQVSHVHSGSVDVNLIPTEQKRQARDAIRAALAKVPTAEEAGVTVAPSQPEPDKSLGGSIEGLNLEGEGVPAR